MRAQPTTRSEPGWTARTAFVSSEAGALAVDRSNRDHGFVLHRSGRSLFASGAVTRIPVATGRDRFTDASSRVQSLLARIRWEDLTGTGVGVPRAMGALPFSMSARGEVIVPALLTGRETDGRWWQTTIEPIDANRDPITPFSELRGRKALDGSVGRSKRRSASRNAPGGIRVRPVQSPAQWGRMIERVLSQIELGRVTKVVVAREVVVEADAPFDRALIIERLRERNPNAYVYGCGAFVGATPELLVERRDHHAHSEPHAGTVRQGTDDDERLIRDLAASAKDHHEHRIVVDAVHDALRPFAETVVVPTTPSIIRHPAVAHLATRLDAHLVDPPATALELVGALHPTPAVGGFPTAAAIEVIDDVEGFERGPYAGPLGWTDANGDGEFVVALRCAQILGRSARLIAGCGIVRGSDPDAEWAESQAKLETMMRSLVLA